ncbi:MAG: low affinity iron permease family protein [Bacteroidota bacterium]
MRRIYRNLEKGFEKIASVAIAILGNSITFIIALCMVIFWLSNKQFYTQNIHNCIGDTILGVAFLSLFIIQKSFNRFSASLHLKVNELVSSHKPANNAVINIEGKTEHEITELAKEYTELAENLKDVELAKSKIKALKTKIHINEKPSKA